MKDDSDNEKQQQIHHIKNLYAFNLFCQKRFDESMQVFAKLGTGRFSCFNYYVYIAYNFDMHSLNPLTQVIN